MVKTHTLTPALPSQAYFRAETWNGFYGKIRSILGELQPNQPLPETLEWTDCRLNPESLIYYDTKEARKLEKGKYSISALYFVDGTLAYYSAQSMGMYVWVASGNTWYKIELDYDIHKHKMTINYEGPEQMEELIKMM